MAIRISDIDTGTVEWTDHPVFKGVRMKHLVTGKDTRNQLSCHLVSVEPFCSLLSHIHSDHNELHEILEGSGECVVSSKNIYI